MPLVDDEMVTTKHRRMYFSEFIEALGRVADWRYIDDERALCLKLPAVLEYTCAVLDPPKDADDASDVSSVGSSSSSGSSASGSSGSSSQNSLDYSSSDTDDGVEEHATPM